MGTIPNRKLVKDIVKSSELSPTGDWLLASGQVPVNGFKVLYSGEEGAIFAVYNFEALEFFRQGRKENGRESFIEFDDETKTLITEKNPVIVLAPFPKRNPNYAGRFETCKGMKKWVPFLRDYAQFSAYDEYEKRTEEFLLNLIKAAIIDNPKDHIKAFLTRQVIDFYHMFHAVREDREALLEMLSLQSSTMRLMTEQDWKRVGEEGARLMMENIHEVDQLTILSDQGKRFSEADLPFDIFYDSFWITDRSTFLRHVKTPLFLYPIVLRDVLQGAYGQKAMNAMKVYTEDPVFVAEELGGLDLTRGPT